MQLRRSILLVLLIIFFIYFEIHSCSEDLVTAPENGKDIPSIINEAKDVFFLDAHHGWVVGSLGTIISTSDGGQTWHGSLIEEVSLNDVHFIDREIGWVVGKEGKIYQTCDGGLTWQRLLFPGPPQDDDLYHVWFPNPTIGFVQGYHGVFKTDDGGIAWENNWLPVVPYRGAWDMCPVDSLTVYLLGSRWQDPDPIIVYRTDDGGEHWYSVPGSEASVLRAILTIHFIDANTGWAGGGVIMKTTDGGSSWMMQVENATVREFFFFDDQTGYAVGGQKIVKTVDGGTSWENVTPADDRIGDLRGIYFLDTQRGWVVGRGANEQIGEKLITHSLILNTEDGGISWTLQDLSFDYTPYLVVADSNTVD